MVEVFAEVWRVLRKDGTVWLNYGDCYACAANGRSAKDTKALGNDDRTFRDKPFSTVTGKRAQTGKHKEASAIYGPNRGYRGANPTNSKRGENIGASIQPNRMPQIGLKPKDLIMMPHRLAIALQDWDWWVRADIVWAKPNPMPESVTDRPTRSHEYIFLLAKSARYYYDAEAVRETAQFPGDNLQDDHDRAFNRRRSTCKIAHQDAIRRGHANAVLVPYADRDNEAIGAQSRHGVALEDEAPRGMRNKRSVWTIPTESYAEAHFATFPQKLVQPCILAGTSEKGCCAECGSPWERIMAPGKSADGGKEYKPGDPSGATSRRACRGGQKEWDNRTPPRELGWRPTCKHDAPTVPCTVLDPFMGCGTTGLIALNYSRNFIGIELNEEYIKLAEKRLHAAVSQELLAL